MRKSDHNYSLARKLRRNLSLPEGLLWRELKARRTGLKFRRQHPFGPYVLDFYCPAAKLGIEIDGIAHEMGNRLASDTKRDAWIRSQGIDVVRIPAKDVLRDPLEVAEMLVAKCKERF